jgi:hypothetical protein
MPDLSWVAHADHVRIARGWQGLNSYWVREYDLVQRGDQIRGFAVFAAGARGESDLKSKGVTLDVPVSALQAFLDVVAHGKPRDSAPTRTVFIDVTDDLPSWVVDVSIDCAKDCVQARTARFASPPTERRPSPWFVWSGDRYVELEGGALEAAITKLGEHLRDDVFDQVLR